MDQNLTDLFDEYARHQQSQNRAPGTIARYRYSFEMFARFLRQMDIPPTSSALTTETMESFAIWLRDTPIQPQRGTTQRAEAGIHAHLRDLRAFTRWLSKKQLIETSIEFPMPRIPKRLFRILNEEELERLWQSKYLTGNGALSIRNRALVALMLDTGLRRQEVANLTLADISLERKRLTVIGKGNKERQMVFSNGVRDYLKEFLAIRGIDDEPLFHLSADGIRTTFRRIQLDVGLEKFSPHVLRHQFATAMLRQGERLEVIGIMLGHEDYNTTRRYISLDESDIVAAHARSSPFEALRQREEPIDFERRRKRYRNAG
jgi:site-specific recombinase XerD